MIPEQRDTRPQRGAWAPGGYLCTCHRCHNRFIGDKRAITCAPCAYDEPDHTPADPGPHGVLEDDPEPQVCRHPAHLPDLGDLIIPEGKRLRHTCPECSHVTLVRSAAVIGG